MAFVVVQFEDCDSLGLVHSSWLTPRKSSSFWPEHYKDQYSFNKAVIKGESVDAEKWKIYKLKRIFRTYDDYTEAKRKVEQAEQTSDLQTDAEDFPLRKRSSIKPRRFILEDSDSSEECNLSNHPRPPKIGKLKKNSTDHSLDSQVSDNTQSTSAHRCDITKAGESNQSTPTHKSQTHKIKRLSDFVLSSTPSSSSTIFPEEIDISNTESFTPTPNFSSHVEPKSLDGIQDETFQKKLIHCLSRIIEQNKEILSILRSTSNNQGYQKPDLPVHLPVKTLEELEKLERHLAEKSNQPALCHYLASLDRTNIQSASSSILRCCLSYGLARNISFLGTRNNKKAFNSYILKQVIVDAVKTAFPQATDRNIEDQIKNWLKRSPKNFIAEQEKITRSNENV